MAIRPRKCLERDVNLIAPALIKVAPPVKPIDGPHQRVWSRSTTASCSPASNSPSAANERPADPLPGAFVDYAGKKKVGTRITKVPTKPKTSPSAKGLKPNRQRRLRFGVERTSTGPPGVVRNKSEDHRITTSTKGTVVPSRTPFTAGQRPATQAPKAELFKSPGGTEYIITPGRHRIEMNEFLASFDKAVVDNGCPRMRGTANYAENIHREWLEAERKLDSAVFLLSYSDSDMERFRQMALNSIFNYAVTHNLHQNTVHLTVLNINRIIVNRVRSRQNEKLSIEFFACTVLAALRNAIKMDEGYEKSDRFRFDPEHIWRASWWLADYCPNQTSQRLNEIEAECMAVLQEPSNPPLAPEFLERYVAVGNWPLYKESYQELGSFLLGLSLFAHGGDNPLKGIPSSKLAAAALALAVKVINTDHMSEKYEFWPERLMRYTGYAIEDLKPGIRGLAYLLRHKPEKSAILEKYYTKWGMYDWR